MPSPISGPTPVLFTHFGEEWLTGAEYVLLDLLAHLDPARISPVVWCNGAPLAEKCRAAGYPTYRSQFAFFLDYPESASPFSARHYAALVREGVSLIRQHGIGVVHANSAAPTQWLVPAAGWTRRPLLTHLHVRYLRRSRYALLLHQADLIVGVAQEVTRDLPGDGYDPARLSTIYNGIDPSRLKNANPAALRARLGIPDGVPVVGCTGSLIQRKGHDVLLRAFAAQPARGPLPHLVIAGSGAEGEALAALAGELRLSGRVHFAGHIPDPASLYAISDVFALASRREGLPLSLAEAGWFGLPSVATGVGGVAEILLNGETGFVVPSEDHAAFGAALARLLDDPALRARMGGAARARVDAGFTVQRMAEEFMVAYEALSKQGARSLLQTSRVRCYLPKYIRV
ncbi:glycosyltransferase [Belnapia moabensis]|uniref:glycosyltransferase n=1 Tax=Belnapia moabensis TaxID=365533 RepID=UPI0006947B47|nr:glycosyltransferase [Belnapia moabensis]